MDLIYENSVSAIETLQTRFQQQKSVFFTISNFGDPRYAFLFYAPLVFSLDRKIGTKLLWVSIIAEWSNQVLKWILHGERPYWWIYETQVYNKTGSNTPAIQQYFMTCETGPGSPSGHAMVSAAVWYILITAFLEKSEAIKKNHTNMLASVSWSVYTILLCVVSLSRVYLAAHFPHQCLLGMIIGCGLAITMNKISLDRLKLTHYVIATFGLLGSAMATYGVLHVLGLNPLWSVDRAVKWCAKQEYIHLDTTPFFSMMRYCGFMLGTGIGLNSVFDKKASEVPFSSGMKITSAILAIGVAKLSERVPLPKFNIAFFYFSAFVANTILPFLMIAMVPYIVSRLWPVIVGGADKRKQQ
ncbi:glucose-6-phosphatase catalytic subunit 1-like [Tachypleus tridentatus]|uniref:glucose-6-phosphatase catalytic subunit 1-like n=1 Tax=Tachypleus tridentatus TaxID=6853 RepID=UPI003FD13B31